MIESHPIRCENLNGASNVLLLAPAFDARTDDACIDLLTVAPPEEANVISITVTQSPEDRVEVWETRVDHPPARTAIVAVGESTRSQASAATIGQNPLAGPEGISVDTVTSPGDLTNIGVRITERLQEWETAEEQVLMCFHSLTPLLQYTSTEQVFRFLHVLGGWIKRSGAIAHYHMDPSAHDTVTVNTFMSVVDAVVELDGEHGVSIRTR